MKVITDKDRIENLAANLREAMAVRRWTQEQLERESGVTQATISQILNARVDPRVTAVFSLAVALHTSVDVLLSEPRARIPQKTA